MFTWNTEELKLEIFFILGAHKRGEWKTFFNDNARTFCEINIWQIKTNLGIQIQFFINKKR